MSTMWVHIVEFNSMHGHCFFNFGLNNLNKHYNKTTQAKNQERERERSFVVKENAILLSKLTGGYKTDAFSSQINNLECVV